MSNAEPSSETGEHGPIFEIVFLLVIGILALTLCVATAYGFAYELTNEGVPSTESTSGLIATVDVPDAQAFIVTFDGALQEGGPTKLTIIDPEGKIRHQADLAPGVKQAELPTEEIILPIFEYDPGSYQIVATHGNEVFGKATITIEPNRMLPLLPVPLLFKYSLVFTVLLLVVGTVAVIRDE